MNKDTIKGKIKEVEGRVQEEFGKLTNRKEDQLKGMGKEVEGRVQQEAGKVKDAAKDAMKRKPTSGRTDTEPDLPEEEYRDRRKPTNAESDVVPNRDDDVGDEVA